jgi:hypothetical protein
MIPRWLPLGTVMPAHWKISLDLLPAQVTQTTKLLKFFIISNPLPTFEEKTKVLLGLA